VVQRLSLVSLALSFAVGIAAAQQRSITGKVVSATSSEPVAGATVSVIGTPISAISNDRGEFSLAGAGGTVTLSVRAVSYKRRQVTVPGDQASVSVSLEPDVFNLEAVVVTGQATGVEQRNLANAVTTVPTEQLNRAPVQTIDLSFGSSVVDERSTFSGHFEIWRPLPSPGSTGTRKVPPSRVALLSIDVRSRTK